MFFSIFCFFPSSDFFFLCHPLLPPLFAPPDLFCLFLLKLKSEKKKFFSPVLFPSLSLLFNFSLFLFALYYFFYAFTTFTFFPFHPHLFTFITFLFFFLLFLPPSPIIPFMLKIFPLLAPAFFFFFLICIFPHFLLLPLFWFLFNILKRFFACFHFVFFVCQKVRKKGEFFLPQIVFFFFSSYFTI